MMNIIKDKKYIQEQLLEFVKKREKEVLDLYDKTSPTGHTKIYGSISCEKGVVPQVEKIRLNDFNGYSSIEYAISKIKPKIEKEFIDIYKSTISSDKYAQESLTVDCKISHGMMSKKGHLTICFSFFPTKSFYNNDGVRDEWYYKFKNNKDIQLIIQDIRKQIIDGSRSAVSIDKDKINGVSFSQLGYPSLNNHQTKMLALVIYDELQFDHIRYTNYDGYNDEGYYYLSNDNVKPQKEW